MPELKSLAVYIKPRSTVVMIWLLFSHIVCQHGAPLILIMGNLCYDIWQICFISMFQVALALFFFHRSEYG